MNNYYTNPEIKDTWDIAQHEVSEFLNIFVIDRWNVLRNQKAYSAFVEHNNTVWIS